jgi:hypothetical protein
MAEVKEPVYWTGPSDISFTGHDVPPLGGIFSGDFYAVVADTKAYFFQRSNYRDETIVAIIAGIGSQIITQEFPKD